ncbi:MAG: bifunctional folylpolyglutamate synthase/dihydrofolate synthase [Alphaproteobacteria bacterium]|nr:bifunctional folylpolyglutamate synthase/dihydrofolate synthase [Alphaproteobacteria bacterium]
MRDTATSRDLLADLKLLHPKLIDLSLGRIERLLAKLGDPHKRLPAVVHVAGTNGKGSTTAFMRAILEAAGTRVHVYTSPHLVRFHERILLAGADGVARPIEEAALVDVLTRTQACNDGDDITQFEITTAAAFLAFSETPADVLLLEVGLGGRLDATNVVSKPELTVITPISVDHSDKLGNTLAEIAAEKAGILKSGIPAVVSRQPGEAADVIERTAVELGVRVNFWGRDFDAFEQNGRLVVQCEDRLLDLPLPALKGPHQIVNAGTAIIAALQLSCVDVDEAAIEAGLLSVTWPARMQRLASGPLSDLLSQGSELWLDGGHNPAAADVLSQTVADLEERNPRPLFLVVGMMGLKDVDGFLARFDGLVRCVCAVPIPGAHEVPLAPDLIVSAAQKIGIRASQADSLEDALREIDRQHFGPKRVLICGSLYLAGQVLALQEGVEPEPN